jgi:hypothetical protein
MDCVSETERLAGAESKTPHSLQNFAVDGISALHCGQCL